MKNFKVKNKMSTDEGPTEEEQFLDLYKETMKKNVIGPRIGHRKNIHTFQFTYRDDLNAFDFPDIKDDGKSLT